MAYNCNYLSFFIWLLILKIDKQYFTIVIMELLLNTIVS